MFAFQGVNSWNAEAGNIDEGTFVVLLPILVLVVPSIYLIRAKMFNKINTADKTLEELEEEFMIKPKGVLVKGDKDLLIEVIGFCLPLQYNE